MMSWRLKLCRSLTNQSMKQLHNVSFRMHKILFGMSSRLPSLSTFSIPAYVISPSAYSMKLRPIFQSADNLPALESRMIASGVRWITNPIAVIVAKQLQPIVNSFEAVARDTADVINAVFLGCCHV